MKKSQSCSFKNATINAEEMTITEYTKDDQYVFDLSEILKTWNQIDGITITIKKDEEVTD